MAKRARKPSRRPQAGRVQEALPALSSLTELPEFEKLTASATQREAYEEVVARLVAEGFAQADELALGCVVRLDRGFPAVACEGATFRCEFSARLTKGEYSKVAVGDWLCVRVSQGHDMGLIEAILPRTNDLARWRGNARGERQTLAANIDSVLVVQALGERGVSADRLARSAMIVRDCGSEVAIVFTKADRVDDEALGAAVALVRDILGSGVKLVLTSSELERAGGEALQHLMAQAVELGVLWGTAGVQALVPKGSVAIMLGESGAGKSTLLNALLGREALETGAVRESDDTGRHTTVARRMVSLPGAGVIVDAPGLRSLPVIGHERGLALVFPDIAEAAQGCRFRDCTHTHEPGCVVQEEFRAGAFSKERLDAYLLLAREMRENANGIDPDVVI